MAKSKAIAVLTGDLVGSEGLTPETLEAAQDALLHLPVGSPFEAQVLGKPQVVRGDEWQLALSDAGQCLRAALLARAALRALSKPGVETRISLGIGDVSRIDEEEISRSSGEAFTLSGRGLESLKNRAGLHLSLREGVQSQLCWASAIVGLCDALSRQWAQGQAAVAAASLKEPELEQKEIAGRIGRQRQSVNRALGVMDWPSLDAALSCFESCSWEPCEASFDMRVV